MSIEGDVAKAALKFGAGHVALIGCLAAALGLFAGYAFWHAHVYSEGFKACQDKVDAVNAQAAADHADMQGQLTGAATTQNPKVEAKVNAISTKLDALIAQAKKPPQVFTNCAPLPADQIAGYNAIR